MSELQQMLSDTIRKAFDNEREFLSRFWSGSPDDQLEECYMAGKRTRIEVVSDGHHVATTISTADFIEWCDGLNNV